MAKILVFANNLKKEADLIYPKLYPNPMDLPIQMQISK